MRKKRNPFALAHRRPDMLRGELEKRKLVENVRKKPLPCFSSLAVFNRKFHVERYVLLNM